MTMSRRLVQISAIMVLLLLPVLSRGSALYQSYGAGARHVGDLDGAWAQFLFSAFGQTFGRLDDPAAAADLFQGSFWSITLFGITFSDPMAFIGHLAAGGAVHWPLAAGVVFAVALAAVAGRFFCGWICPVNTLLELNGSLRGWIERRVAARRLPGFVAPSWARYAVLIGATIVSAVAGFNLFAFILPYVGLARDWYLFVYGATIGFGMLFMVVLVAVELLIAPRLWCRGLCPTGLLLELIGRRRLFGIRRKASGACLEGCHACLVACPVGVNPRDEIATESCLMCNVCVSRCPAGVLEFGLAAPVRKRARRGKVAGAALGAAVLAVLPFALPGDALAHHIKGLPHYGYLENYPQTPTREVRFAAPPYKVTLVSYVLDGLERGRSDTPDDVMLYVTVTDGRTGKAYTGPLTVTIQAAGGGPPLRRKFKAPLEETVYRMRATMPAPEYDLAIRIGRDPGVTARTRLSLASGGIGAWTAAMLAVIAAAAIGLGAIYLRRLARIRRLTLKKGA